MRFRFSDCDFCEKDELLHDDLRATLSCKMSFRCKIKMNIYHFTTYFMEIGKEDTGLVLQGWELACARHHVLILLSHSPEVSVKKNE